ncbi:MAG: hypothetical protein QOC80_2922 [Frankiaceae bacterium]|nr:hypothetical protein [Frankiaceae bacterium]
MRIAVVCSDTGIRLPGSKGASLHLAAVSNALAGLGHEVLLLGVAGEGPPPATFRTRLLPPPARSSGVRDELRKLAFQRQLLQQGGDEVRTFAPDIVYERTSLFGGIGARLAADTGAPHVVEINALLAEEATRYRGLRLQRLARLRETQTVREADLRVVVSDELARRVAVLAPAGPTEVVENGVDDTCFASLPGKHEARRMLGLPPDTPTIGFSGSLRPWHGLRSALEALTALPGVVLAVAGSGPLRAELEGVAKSLQVADRIRWLGQLDHDRVPVFLSALDVAIAPYPMLPDFSFSPLKVYEYLAAGLPIVASDVGTLSRLLSDRASCRLVPPSDPAALAWGVADLLANLPSARAAAVPARAEALRDHSWRRRAEQLTQLFSEATAHALAG